MDPLMAAGDVPAPAHGPAAAGAARPALLMVSTVSATIAGFLLPYAAHFRERGWRVDAAAAAAPEDRRLDGWFDHRHDVPFSRSIRDLPAIVRSERALSRIVGEGYDVVHVHTPIAAFLARLAARRLPAARRPAVVYTAHGLPFYRGGGRLGNAAFVLVERVAGRWTDRLVVINEEDRAAALRHRLVPASRLVWMPGIGLDTAWYARDRVPLEAIAAARAGLAIPPGAPMLVMLAELTPRKRPLDGLAALAGMRRRDAHLVLLGDGPLRGDVVAFAAEAGVAGRVHLGGVVDDVRPTLAGADALLLASRTEGLPRSVMEALCLGVPVVVSDVRGSADLVAPDAGIVVPPGDVGALAAALDRVLDAPGEARAMADRGRARMVERYDVGALLARHATLYATLLEERARRAGGRA